MRVPTFYRHGGVAASDQAMTPMIDVVFLLLIFFVCASVGTSVEEVLPTELQGTGIAADLEDLPQEESEPVWIKLIQTAGGVEADVNGSRQSNLDELSTILRTLREVDAAASMSVVLDVARDVPIGSALRVYDECLQSGFDSIDFAVGESP